MPSFAEPSQGHSAHIGEFVTVHYPHHPLFGTRVRRQGVDKRKDGTVAHIETAPGIVIIIPVWMLDPIACTGMELGEPRVSREALIDLAGLLTAQCVRESSSTDDAVMEEPRDEAANTKAKTAHQSTPDDHGVRVAKDVRDEPTSTRSRTDSPCNAVDGGGPRREGGTA